VVCVPVFPEYAIGLVMSRHAVAGVLGLVDPVLDELAHVAVLDAIEDLVALSSGGDQAGCLELREMLRDAGRGLLDRRRQPMTDISWSTSSHSSRTQLRICVHAQIVSQLLTMCNGAL